jgi:hypothetical protein
MTGYIAAILAYAAPTFALGYVWHLVLFEEYYRALAIYRSDLIVPFGFVSILIQGMVFASVNRRLFVPARGGYVSGALAYGAAGALLSWSFTTLAVAAKNIMSSVPDYLVIETAFTIVQWTIVAPLTVAVSARWAPSARVAPDAA